MKVYNLHIQFFELCQGPIQKTKSVYIKALLQGHDSHALKVDCYYSLLFLLVLTDVVSLALQRWFLTFFLPVSNWIDMDIDRNDQAYVQKGTVGPRWSIFKLSTMHTCSRFLWDEFRSFYGLNSKWLLKRCTDPLFYVPILFWYLNLYTCQCRQKSLPFFSVFGD